MTGTATSDPLSGSAGPHARPIRIAALHRLCWCRDLRNRAGNPGLQPPAPGRNGIAGD